MKKWIHAIRLRTLPLALASIIAGILLSVQQEHFDSGVAWLCVSTAVLLQITSNLANDLGDTQHGADHAERQGPQRAVQSGAISLEAMKKAVILFSLLSFASGLWLLLRAFSFYQLGFWLFLCLGILSIIAALLYTLGKKPYGYAGLGDVFVFLFFGWVSVLGTSYVCTRQMDWLYLLPASVMGLFCTGVLHLNNVRDTESDRQAGKKSIPVRFGKNVSIAYHWFLLLSGWLLASLFVWLRYAGWDNLIYFLALPFFLYNGWQVSIREAAALDPLLRQLALAILLFVVLFGFGMLA